MEDDLVGMGGGKCSRGSRDGCNDEQKIFHGRGIRVEVI